MTRSLEKEPRDLHRDLALYGTAFELIHDDGSREVLDPWRIVMHTLPGAEGKEDIEALNEVD